MLGVKIDLEPSHVADCIDEVGIGFLFAPIYHGAMKQCAGGPTRDGDPDHSERARSAGESGRCHAPSARGL